ncbi:hypothetical protein ACFO1B_07975 [Dactylosporangium siamense]|uniref:Uncharacterized protein n=1 Tax=Dactylosporangium siamense TaxID=685454 RepID=A0A919PNZ3_9ACTN|nr:hypothetical protein [Dactylosporangium siamense]GIG48076.1 hypothetical protein Dsi01nite_061170 [Dactylosporangium siamense]
MVRRFAADSAASHEGTILEATFSGARRKEVDKGKFRDGPSCEVAYEDFDGHSIWAIDVDHGEIWAGTPYQYTGHFDRYVVWNPTKPSYPGFR